MRNQGRTKAKDRRIYCGAYVFTVDAVRKLRGTKGLPEVVSADVVHKIEDGEVAHAALLIELHPGTTNVEGTKTAIIDRLWQVSGGPLKHTCECDHDVKNHPSQNLSSAARQVTDDAPMRTGLRRTWQARKFRYDCKLAQAISEEH
jgi:hypothetical protein